MNRRQLRELSRVTAEQVRTGVDRLQEEQKCKPDYSELTTDELIVYRGLWYKLHADAGHVDTADLLSVSEAELCRLAAHAHKESDSPDVRHLNDFEREEFERLIEIVGVVE